MKAICEMTYEEANDAYMEAVTMAGDVVNVTSRERAYWFDRAEAIWLYVCENFFENNLVQKGNNHEAQDKL